MNNKNTDNAEQKEEQKSSRQLFIQIPDKEKLLVLPYDENTTILKVKEMLIPKLGLGSPAQITLMNGAKALENDDMTLGQYGVCKGTAKMMLFAVRKVNTNTQFFIRAPGNQILDFTYEPGKTIGELKLKLESFVDVAAKRQILICENSRLYDDSKTLEECLISVGDTLELEVKPPDIVRLWIQVDSSYRIPIEMSLNDKVRTIKKRLKEELQVRKRRQILVYEWLELKNSDLLKHCDIEDDSIINFYKIFKLEIAVKQEDEDGERETIRVKAHTNLTIKDLKKEISREYSVKPKYQILSDSKGIVLKDGRTLAHYKINEKSILYLELL